MKVLIMSLLLLISTMAMGACPKGFVAVPANKTTGVNKEFCVMKYPAKAKEISSKKVNLVGCGDLDCRVSNWADVSKFKAVSVAEGIPWRQVNFENAKKACASLGEGFGLINNREWMTIVENILSVASNWSKGKVGEGAISRGHSDRDPNQPCDSIVENVKSSCDGKGSGHSQKRTHKLSNGSVVWDLAGNLWEWVDWKVQFQKGASPADTWVELDRIRPKIETGQEVDLSEFKSMKLPKLNSRQGIGSYWSEAPRGESVAIRGGRWSHRENAGILTLDLSTVKESSGARVTFRCVKR